MLTPPPHAAGGELFDRAEAALRRMLAAEPRNAAALARLGDLGRARGDFAAALTAYRRLLAAAPDDAAASEAVRRLLLHDAGRAEGSSRVEPLRGGIVFFPGDCLHEITPVACGAGFGDGRFTVNGWVSVVRRRVGA